MRYLYTTQEQSSSFRNSSARKHLHLLNRSALLILCCALSACIPEFYDLGEKSPNLAIVIRKQVLTGQTLTVIRKQVLTGLIRPILTQVRDP